MCRSARHILLAAAAAVCATLLAAPASCDEAPAPTHMMRMSSGMLAAMLQGGVSGTVITPSQALNGLARGEALNRTLSGYSANPFPEEGGQLPLMLLQPRGVQDIAAALRFAQTYGLPVGVQGGAHSTRNLWNVKDGLTISMGAYMHTPEADGQKRVVSVQGGSTYAEITDVAAPFGLALPWGTSYQTGLGLALNGGLGLLTRAYGLTSDNLVDATLVLANGTMVLVDASRPELFAAMRGAGSTLGVVAEASYRLHDVSAFYGGALTLEDDAAGKNFRAVWNWSAAAVAQAPELGIEVVKEVSLEGTPVVRVLAGYPGNTSEAKKAAVFEPLLALEPVVQNTLGQLDYFATEMVQTNASILVNYGANYALGATLSFQEADAALLERLTGLTAGLPPGLTARLACNFLGNSVANNSIAKGANASFTPFAAEDVDVHAYALFSWPADAANSSAYLQLVQQRQAQLEPWVLAVQPYVNLATFNKEANLSVQLGGEDNLKRLRALKQAVDPRNAFPNHPFANLYAPVLNAAGMAGLPTAG